jgi:hypothetical protein
MTWVLVILAVGMAAAAVYFATRAPVVGAGQADAFGRPAPAKTAPVDSHDDALGDAVGKTVADIWSVASLYLQAKK